MGGHHCRSENILLLQPLTLLSCSSLQRIFFFSTKGKLFNILWEHARPSHGQHPCAGKKLSPCHNLCPDRDPATFPLGESPRQQTPCTSPSVPRQEIISNRLAQACSRAGDHVTSCRCLCVLRMVGARRASSICPSPLLACSLPPVGQREAGWTPCTVWVPLCFICSYQRGNRVFFVWFWTGRWSGQDDVFAWPCHLPLLFSVWRQEGKISPHGMPRAALAGPGVCSSLPATPLPPARHPHRRTLRADAAPQPRAPFVLPPWHRTRGVHWPWGSRAVTGADSPPLRSLVNGLYSLPAFPCLDL